LSIEAQLAELREFAKQNNLFIVREFTESKTAKEPGREIFNEMLSEIEKGNAQGILAWNPDRLARNSIDGGKIIYLVDTGKIQSLKFPTFWFEATPQGKFMLSVAFGQAKYYTDNLRENILRGIRQKLRRGELPAKAPLGYFNEPRLRTIEPDPKTFHKVRKILKLFAAGNYTLTQIRDKMFSFGLMNKEGKPLHLSTIQGVLTNPFYYGMFKYRGELHQGSHKPMISKKLFDKIQQALKNNGKPRKKKNKKPFLFLNFAKCGECGYSITAERHIKKSGLEFIYYRCTKKSKTIKCRQSRFLREEKLAEQIKEHCQKVSLPDV
jgi:DNA invertase Pin-like site-specific DNA recombinase